jgi:hypothetical protein
LDEEEEEEEEERWSILMERHLQRKAKFTMFR